MLNVYDSTTNLYIYIYIYDTFYIFRLEEMELYHLDLFIMIPTTQPLQVPSLDYI